MGVGGSRGDIAGTCARRCCVCTRYRHPRRFHRWRATPAVRSDSCLRGRGTGTLQTHGSGDEPGATETKDEERTSGWRTGVIGKSKSCARYFCLVKVQL